MAEDRSRWVDLLGRIHLFAGLNEEELNQIARVFRPRPVAAGVQVFPQGAPSDGFYLILRGKVRVTRREGEKTRLLATLEEGDFFGEEGMLYRRPRPATVTALEPSVLLWVDKKGFRYLLSQVPKLRSKLVVSVETRQRVRRLRFDWLNPGEVIYYLGRKHEAVLWTNLTLPALVAMFAVPFLGLYLFISMTLALGLAGAIILIAIAWGIWRWVDWGNDYYMVTNQRVIWLEKVVGMYDSRHEAPMRTVLSVNASTDQLGRVLGYGDVIIRTYTGKIVFRHVGRPQLVCGLIEEHWNRTRNLVEKDDDIAIERAIRQRLGLPVEVPLDVELDSEEQEPPTPQEKPAIFQLIFRNFFKVRYEDGDVVTYRKHWFVLVKESWKPALGLWLSVLMATYWYLRGMAAPSFQTVLLMSAALFTVCFLWWGYEYLDWRNDVYQVTSEHIVDLDRTPLGREQRRTALLENILSLDYERTGILGLLLNFGNVTALVGGEEFTFEGVYNPAEVQQDVFQRMEARLRCIKETEAEEDRRRLAEWLSVYHRNVEEFRQLEQSQQEGEEHWSESG